MVAPISSSDESGKQQRLAAWATYIAKSAKLKSEPAAKSATLNTSARELASHQCPICSGQLGTTPVPLGLAELVDVNLSGELTDEEKQMVQQLRQRDAEVRRHEQAHLMAAGPYAMGSPSYTYQTGPDGQRYAVGGEVQIDLSPVPGDPEATLRKARQLQQAALAPAEPSATDRQVAMAASRMAQEALQELAEEQFEKMKEARKERQAEKGSEAQSAQGAEQSSAKDASSSELDPSSAPTGAAEAVGIEPGDLGPSTSEAPVEVLGVASLDTGQGAAQATTTNLDLYI